MPVLTELAGQLEVAVRSALQQMQDRPETVEITAAGGERRELVSDEPEGSLGYLASVGAIEGPFLLPLDPGLVHLGGAHEQPRGEQRRLAILARHGMQAQTGMSGIPGQRQVNFRPLAGVGPA